MHIVKKKISSLFPLPRKFLHLLSQQEPLVICRLPRLPSAFLLVVSFNSPLAHCEKKKACYKSLCLQNANLLVTSFSIAVNVS